MQKTYVYDSDRGAWFVALVLADDGDTRDLKVYEKPGRPQIRRAVRRFDPRRGGWSDARRHVPDECELAALEAIAAHAALEAEADEPAVSVPAPTEPAPPSEGPSFDPGDLTVDELEEHLADVEDLEDLALIRFAELEGKGRKGALEAIDDRAAAIPAQGDGDHDDEG